ncbi:MAG: bifunctional riboflavin kinase/FAD synthetase [Nitrospirales bacterium]
MKVIRNLPTSTPAPHPVLTIGNFDGQHVGHQALLAAVVEMANRHQGTPMVLTFDPHPSKILAPGKPLQFLTPKEEKMEFFEKLGVAELVILEFSLQLASLTPEEFTSKVLRDGVGVRELLIGENFVFGKGRSGDVQDLISLGSQANFRVHPMAPVEIDGDIVSSTRIRKLLQAGQVKAATQCLGRPYRLTEHVIQGEKRGAQLGWPTANLRIAPHRVIPADGIYATMAYVQGEWLPSVSYIGNRPTFIEGERLLEVHLFDQDRSLYGERIQVSFIDFIRGDKQFSDAKNLLDQIEHDASEARGILQKLSKDYSQYSEPTSFHSSSYH